MIPLIGFMIGAYIITRMVEILISEKEHGFLAACAVITIIVVLFCILGLVASSMPNLSSIPGQ